MYQVKKVALCGLLFFLCGQVFFVESSEKKAWDTLKNDYVRPFKILISDLKKSKKNKLNVPTIFPLPNPAGLRAYKKLFLKKAQELGVPEKEIKRAHELALQKIRDAQIKTFWHNKRVFCGNPFVILANGSSVSPFVKESSEDNLFFDDKAKSEPSYVWKYRICVEMDNCDFLKQEYEKSFVESLDAPKNVQKELFEKPVERCDLNNSLEPVMLTEKDLLDKQDGESLGENDQLEMGTDNNLNFSLPQKKTPIDMLEDLLSEYCQVLDFNEHEEFELWLQCFCKDANDIEGLAQKYKAEGLWFLFMNAKTTKFEKDQSILFSMLKQIK